MAIHKSIEKGSKLESYKDLIDLTIKDNVKYNVIEEDFEGIGDLSLKEFINKALSK